MYQNLPAARLSITGSRLPGLTGSPRFHRRPGRTVGSAAVLLLIVLLVLTAAGVFLKRNLRTAPALSAVQPVPVVTKAVFLIPEVRPDEEKVIADEPEIPFTEIPRIPGVPRIMVDPGHGGMDDGCVSKAAIEKEINLELALLLEQELTGLGYQVILTRDTDVLMSVEERVERANFYQADVFISIHQNSYEGEAAAGVEVWYQGDDAARDNERLARVVRQQAVVETGAAEREMRAESELYVTNHTTMPACLIETGFLSNRAERAKLLDPEYRRRLAQGMARGIELFLVPETAGTSAG